MEQSVVDAAAAIEGVAQELDALGRTASAKILRRALDMILEVDPNAPLPPADDQTRATVERAHERFLRGTAFHLVDQGGDHA